jgi:hypothetical protein
MYGGWTFRGFQEVFLEKRVLYLNRFGNGHRRRERRKEKRQKTNPGTILDSF